MQCNRKLITNSQRECGKDGLVTFTVIFCGTAVPAPASFTSPATASPTLSSQPTGTSDVISATLTVVQSTSATSDPPMNTGTATGQPTTTSPPLTTATTTMDSGGTATQPPAASTSSATGPDPTSWPSYPLHPNFDSSKCLDVQGNNQADGTLVQLYDCNGTPAQQWQLIRGATQIRLANTVGCDSGGEYDQY